jgi:hypothetical protein
VPGSNRTEATEDFLAPLHDAVSCVTDEGLRVYRHPGPDDFYVLTLTGDPVKLNADPPLRLSLTQLFRLVENRQAPRHSRWRVGTLRYVYTALESDDRTEIFSYHWEPEGAVSIPHLHIPVAASEKRRRQGKYHFPTGRIAIEQVLWVLIRDFRVPTLREDWETRLRTGQAIFDQNRTWNSTPGSPRDQT